MALNLHHYHCCALSPSDRESQWGIWEVEFGFVLCQWYGGILSYKSLTKSKLTVPGIDAMMMQFVKHCMFQYTLSDTELKFSICILLCFCNTPRCLVAIEDETYTSLQN